MQPATIKKLTTLTTQFYTKHALAFAASRQTAWPGWSQLTPWLSRKSTVTLLDVGSGNGRLLQLLDSLEICGTYVGLDNNSTLLQSALYTSPRSCLHVDQYQVEDLLSADMTPPPGLPNRAYTHMTIFGVLHHIPSINRQLQFLSHWLRLLQPGGYLLVTFWQPLSDSKRFISKKLNPDQFGIAAQDLAPNDLLLGWGSDQSVARYCHSFTSPEIQDITSGLTNHARLVTTFTADGKSGHLNTYQVWQKNAPTKT